jgi:hypothetical protein
LYERLAVTDDNLNVVHVQRVGETWRVTRTSLMNLDEPSTIFQVDKDGMLQQVATSNSCTVFTVESFGTNCNIKAVSNIKNKLTEQQS